MKKKMNDIFSSKFALEVENDVDLEGAPPNLRTSWKMKGQRELRSRQTYSLSVIVNCSAEAIHPNVALHLRIRCKLFL